MNRKVIAAVLVLLVVGSSADALNGPRRALLFGGERSQPVVPNTMSIDGSNIASAFTGGITVDLTTAMSNDVIIVIARTSGGPITGVSSPNIGAFTKRASAGPTTNEVELWYAIATGPLTTEMIGISGTTTAFMAAAAFGVNGAKISAPFDTNASLPNVGTSDPGIISTTAADTMIIGGFAIGASDPSAGPGYTEVATQAGSFLLAEYKLVTAPQTNLAVTAGTGAGSSTGVIGDALVQGP